MRHEAVQKTLGRDQRLSNLEGACAGVAAVGVAHIRMTQQLDAVENARKALAEQFQILNNMIKKRVAVSDREQTLLDELQAEVDSAEKVRISLQNNDATGAGPQLSSVDNRDEKGEEGDAFARKASVIEDLEVPDVE